MGNVARERGRSTLAPAQMSCARTERYRQMTINQMCSTHRIACLRLAHTKWQPERKRATRREKHEAYNISTLGYSFCCFITPARHLVHNTSLLHAIVCSFTLNRSIAISRAQTLFVHLHTHTHTHSSMFHTQFTVVVVIVFSARLCCCCCDCSRSHLLHWCTEPDYDQMETLDLSLNYMYLSFSWPHQNVCVCVCFALVFIWAVVWWFFFRFPALPAYHALRRGLWWLCTHNFNSRCEPSTFLAY